MTTTGAVFVVGSYRSGTTWLGRMLATHDDIAIFPGEESNLFTALSAVWRAHEATSATASTATDDEVTRTLRTFCERILRGALPQTTSHVLDKTPAHVHRLELIGRVYPEAWVIHIVRDGRDVARSLREYEHGPATLREAALEWARAIDAGRRDGPNLRRFREVRYEDLLADPSGGVTDLLEWMQLPVSNDVRAAIDDQAGVRVSQHNTTGDVGAGKWQKLTSDEQHEIELAAGAQLRLTGYL